MKKYMTEYMNSLKAFLDNELDSSDAQKKTEVLKELEIKITYFQHERLIHLIVTVLFAVLEIISVLSFFSVGNFFPLVLAVMLLILLVPYIFHYFFLENSVQELYVLRDRLKDSIDSPKRPTETA